MIGSAHAQSNGNADKEDTHGDHVARGCFVLSRSEDGVEVERCRPTKKCRDTVRPDVERLVVNV